MKQNRNYQILAWILAFLPAVAVAALYSRLPDQLPMQWDFGGQERYEPKAYLDHRRNGPPLLRHVLGAPQN